MLAAAIRAGEQRILSVQRDRADAALHHVGIDLDAAIIQEAVSPSQRGERVGLLRRVWSFG